MRRVHGCTDTDKPLAYVDVFPTMPAFADIAIDPPLADSYRALALLRRDRDGGIAPPAVQMVGSGGAVLERDLPMVDLERLTRGGAGERKACAGAMARAASEWGFFQLTNHGVGRELMEEMRREQARLFRLPFETKEKAGLLNGSYRWVNPTATSLRHLSWSEAFHVPLASISGADCDFGDLTSLRYVQYVLCLITSSYILVNIRSGVVYSVHCSTPCCFLYVSLVFLN